MYPQWQQKIRAAQHEELTERESERQIAEIKEIAFELRCGKSLSRALVLLGVIDPGVNLLQNEYKIDDYRFYLATNERIYESPGVNFWEGEVNYANNQKAQEVKFKLWVSKLSPEIEALGWDYDDYPTYLIEVRNEVGGDWTDIQATVAGAIDTVDEKYQRMLDVLDRQKSAPVAPAQNNDKPDLDTLASIIRQMVREEIATSLPIDWDVVS